MVLLVAVIAMVTEAQIDPTYVDMEAGGGRLIPSDSEVDVLDV